MPLEGEIGNLQIFSIGRMPGDRTLLSLDASYAIPTRVLPLRRFRTASSHIGQIGAPHRSTSLELQQHRLRFSDLGFVDQPRNPVVF
jgi:hypothetical protein